MKITFEPYCLDFKFDAGTSRGILKQKRGFILKQKLGNTFAMGELSLIPGLGLDASVNYAVDLPYLLEKYHNGLSLFDAYFNPYPSFVFALEMLQNQQKNAKAGICFDNSFSDQKSKIPINGLVWMGTESFMLKQAEEKLAAGFTTIKFKIGAIEFDKEIALIRAIRKRFSSEQITIRVDANGGFTYTEVFEVLKELKAAGIHSIEQPIGINQWDAMAELAQLNRVPIALDEELLYIADQHEKLQMLKHIKPQFLVLKPSLLGGFTKTDWWIKQAEVISAGWWVTSALESNIGLEAICQFTANYTNTLPQGLGTGALYHKNFESNLKVDQGYIFC